MESFSLTRNASPLFDGNVLVIGAGAAGLTAGYHLHRHGIDFQMLEASANYGGRMKRADQFVDFPIDLGAEWIHVKPSILETMVDDPGVEVGVETMEYNPQSIATWKKGRLRKKNWARSFYSEYKFKRTTWYGFFERYIVPHVQDHLFLNQPVEAIDHAGKTVKVITASGEVFEADKAIITVPIKLLQDSVISFYPELPKAKQEAIDGVFMGDGIKVFLEFEERFYPDILLFGNLISAALAEEKIFYDAAFGKDTDRQVLGVFAIGEGAIPYTRLDTDQAIVQQVIDELDKVFGGKASKAYTQHVVQNWSREPFIRGSYSTTFVGSRTKTMKALAAPVGDKLYFAGEALSKANQAMVQGASETGVWAVEQVLYG